MNSDLIKLKVKGDAVIDIDIQNEIRLKDRMNSLGIQDFILLKIQVMNY